ncbi:MAG: hypothetical protein NTZ17_14510 [Phycisphaerae bacterium]|nr:hypothetical protein [Phycisphaerae bacterium]
MNVLSTTISRSMEAVPWTLDVVFPDVGDLLPFAAVCLASILCTALWLLAVSSHVSRAKANTAL